MDPLRKWAKLSELARNVVNLGIASNRVTRLLSKMCCVDTTAPMGSIPDVQCAIGFEAFFLAALFLPTELLRCSVVHG